MSAFQAGSARSACGAPGARRSEPFVDQFVSGNYFTLFGLRPYAGRLLGPSDDRRGAAPVAVMSYRAWQRALRRAIRSVIGRHVRHRGAPFTVVGIAPPGFFGARFGPIRRTSGCRSPLSPWSTARTHCWTEDQPLALRLRARIKPGCRVAQVEAKLNGTAQLAARQ